MHALIFDIKHFAVHDGPGIRTTIFFKGCPLRCWWCHNPESISPKPESIEVKKRIGEHEFTEIKEIGSYKTVDELLVEIEKDKIFYEESGGGATFSGGEPFVQAKVLKEIASECKKRNIHTALDTSGYATPETFIGIARHIDLFLFDIKHLDPEKHQKYTGASNQVILENLEYLAKEGKQVIIRYPLIPHINNSGKELGQLEKLAQKLTCEIHFLPYHKIGTHKYKQLGLPNRMDQAEELPGEYYEDLKKRFEDKGFKIRIGG